MPITETLTWYTPDEKMPERKQLNKEYPDLLISKEFKELLSDNVYKIVLKGYFNGHIFQCDNGFGYSKTGIFRWAYMPKGEADDRTIKTKAEPIDYGEEAFNNSDNCKCWKEEE